MPIVSPVKDIAKMAGAIAILIALYAIASVFFGVSSIFLLLGALGIFGYFFAKELTSRNGVEPEEPDRPEPPPLPDA